MKKLILIFYIINSFLFSEYLQNGIYSDCSYVIVDHDGWKIHKNKNGKTISMTPKNKHNVEPGKYSFDKFGNLVPFRECESNNQINDVLDNTEIEISVQISLFKNIDFSIYSGGSIPFGENINQYELGPQVGLDIKLENYVLSLNGQMHEYTNESSIKYQMLSNNLFLGYNINFRKLYIIPSIGIFSRTKQTKGIDSTNTEEAIDLGIQGELGFNIGRFSIYTSGNLTTTLLENDQTATFYNLGLKYNF
tara:strand:+ start:2139 stop:2885 length:747 start_codon:yes stop_codon:yes gene_type:complete